MKRWVVPAAPVAAATVLFLLVVFSGDVEWSPQRWAIVFGFEVAVAVVLTAAVSEGAWINRLLSARLLVFFGAISYGLYLWHIPVQFILEGTFSTQHPLLLMTSVLLISTAIAFVSLRLLETPMRREGLAAFKKLRLPPRTTGATLGTTAVVTSIILLVVAVPPSQNFSPDSYIVSSVAAPPPTSITPTKPSSSVVSPSTVPRADQQAIIPPGSFPDPSDRPPRVFLAGDSMAQALSEWLIPNQESLGVVASASTHIGCGIGGMIPSGGVFNIEFAESCDRWRTEMPAIAKSAAPDVTILVRFATREPPGNTDKCEPEYLKSFGDALKSEVETVHAETGTPVVITTLPYNRIYGLGQEQDEGVDCLNKTMLEIGMKEKIPVIDLWDWTCPNKTCREKEGEVVLRPDGLHYSGSGAGVTLSWIFEQIFVPQ